MAEKANQRGGETSAHPDHFFAEWRQYRGYTQQELGDLVGASNSKISRLESGETELRPGFAKKVARFFNIPFMALFTINPLGDGKDQAEILDAIADIAPEDRPAALRMLRALSRRSTDRQTG